jgi:hypothetical protein
MTVRVQNHIHLGTVIVPDNENAPQYKWKTIERAAIPVVFMAAKRALNGKLRIHTLNNTASQPIDLVNFEYVIKCADTPEMNAQQWLDLLFSFQGRRVYLVDHYHPDNNLDHSAYVRPMGVVRVGEAQKFTTMLNPYYVQIALEDDRI